MGAEAPESPAVDNSSVKENLSHAKIAGEMSPTEIKERDDTDGWNVEVPKGDEGVKPAEDIGD
jgi:hypothetical protein